MSGIATLKDLRFPNTLTVLQSNALSGCNSLKSIEFNSNIKLKQDSFNGMMGLESLKIPIDDIDAINGNLGLSANSNLRQITCFNSNPT